MKKIFLIILLTGFAFTSFAQKMTIRTCEIQYGDVLNHNLLDVVMDGDPCPYVAKFQLTKDYFIQILDGGKYKYNYVESCFKNLLSGFVDFFIGNWHRIVRDRYLPII